MGKIQSLIIMCFISSKPVLADAKHSYKKTSAMGLPSVLPSHHPVHGGTGLAMPRALTFSNRFSSK